MGDRILRCIGRTDSLGDPHEYGSHIGFVFQYHPATARHTIVLEETDAERLLKELTDALYEPEQGAAA